jgi:hypothetical protein
MELYRDKRQNDSVRSMVGSTTVMASMDEEIEQVIEKASTIKGMIGAERKYDILFTNAGIAMILMEGAMKKGIGGLGPADVLVNKVISNKRVENERASYGGMSLQEMLQKNEKNLYYPYHEVKSVTLKKSLVGCSMNLEMGGEKYKCSFSSDQMEKAQVAISKHLQGKTQ